MNGIQKVSELDRKIQESVSPDQANYFRTRIAALQKLIPKRRESFVDAFDAATAYLKASIKAGELWAGTEKRGAGQRRNVKVSTFAVSATDAGFASRQDAQICLRLAEAAQHDQLNTYLDDCRQRNDLPTIGGFHEIWKRYVQEHPEITDPEVPEGTFGVVVVDPPWAYESRAEDTSHRARNPYPSMSLEEIAALPITTVLAPDAVLWLWTTNAFTHDAYHLLDGWRLEPKTILTWAKPKMGLGDWLRGKTEHCILAVRGEPRIHLTNQTTLLDAPAREHSRKPDEFYKLVEDLCPSRRRLDWFSREARDGWHQYGNQTGKFAA